MPGSKKDELARGFRSAAWFGTIVVLVALLTWILPGLRSYGVRPREIAGLAGVVWGPLLHANFAHLAANLLPLLVLTFILFSDRRYRPVPTLAIIWLIAGVGTWLIGRGGSVHLGASSIIYGLVTYLVVAGMRIQAWRPVLVAVAVLLLYGGIVYGVLPRQGHVSWEGHLSGAIGGVLAALFIHD